MRAWRASGMRACGHAKGSNVDRTVPMLHGIWDSTLINLSCRSGCRIQGTFMVDRVSAESRHGADFRSGCQVGKGQLSTRFANRRCRPKAAVVNSSVARALASQAPRSFQQQALSLVTVDRKRALAGVYQVAVSFWLDRLPAISPSHENREGHNDGD